MYSHNGVLVDVAIVPILVPNNNDTALVNKDIWFSNFTQNVISGLQAENIGSGYGLPPKGNISKYPALPRPPSQLTDRSFPL